MICSRRLLLTLLSAFVLSPLGVASAQSPIKFRTANNTEFTDTTQVIIADVCLGALGDSTIYFRQSRRTWTPVSVTDGVAPNCPGSGQAWQIEGELRAGTNYLVVTATTAGPFGTTYRDSVSLILLVAPPGGGPSTAPAVTAPAPAGISLPPGQVHSLPFVITNVGTAAAQFSAVLQCTGAVTGCTNGGLTSFSTSTIAAGGSQTFQISVPPASLGGSGIIRLIATGTVLVDTGTTLVGVGRPALTSLTVTRMADTIRRPASSASVAYFRVWNPDAFATRTAALTLGCVGMSNCTATPSAPTLAPMSEAIVRVNFTSPASGTKNLVLSATANDGPAAGVDTVRVKNGSALPTTIVVSAHEPTPRSSVSRGACLSVAAGPGAGVECGELRMAYSFPSVRSMNKERALRLIYLSQHATPSQTIPVRVWIKAKTDSVNLIATLTVNGSVILRTVAWNPACAMAAGCVLNVPLNADSLNLVTRDYSYTLNVKLAGADTASGTVSGTVIVVNRKTSVFGAGWWVDGLETLMIAGTDTARRLWIGGDGSARLFVPTSGGWYAPKDTVDRPERLQRVGTGSSTTWVRHLRNGVTVTFDNAYRHVSTTNREGHVTRFGYSSASSSRLIRVTPPYPASDSMPYLLQYDSTLGTPRLRTVLAPAHDANLAYTLATDSARRVLAFAEPSGDSVKYTYSGTSRLPASRIDRMGQPVLYEYSQGYVTRVKTAFNQGGTSDTIATRFCSAEGRTLTACAIDGTTVAAIPAARFVSRIDGPLSTGGLEDVTRFTIGRYGAVDTIVDVYGNTTSVTRGNSSFPLLATKVIDPAGVETHASYNSRGLPTSTRTVNAWSPGSSDTTLFTWHPTWDMVTETRDPTGVIARFGIDSLTGNRLWHQTGTHDSTRTYIQYDGLGRPMMIYALPAVGIDTLGRFEYSAVSGNVLTAISATGQRTRFSMYYSGRVYETRTTLSDTTWESGSAVLRQRFVFDSAWRVVIDSTIAPSRNWVISHYGQSLTGTTASLAAIVTSGYDKEGRPLWVTRTTPGADYVAATATSYFGYDNLGRQRTSMTTGSAADSTDYDRAGRAIRMRTRAGHVVTQTYDLLGRLLTRTTSEVRQAQAFCSDCDVGQELQYLVRVPYFATPLTTSYSSADVVIPVETSVFGYDQYGRMTQADNEQARIRRSYFPNGALKTDSTVLRFYSSTASDPNFTAQHVTGLSFTYDRSGRRLSRTDTWGKQTYEYNGLGQLTQTRDSTMSAGLGATVSFSYDRRGRLATQVVPGALTESWEYDVADRPTSRTGPMGESVTYDIGGRRLAVSGTVDLATGASFAMVAAYDAFGHLVVSGTQGVGVNATDEYFPDGFGNSIKRYGNRGQALSMPETAEASNFVGSRLSSTSVVTHPDEPTRTGMDGGPPVQAYNALDIQHDGAGNVKGQASVRWIWVNSMGGGNGAWGIAVSGHNWTWTTFDANNRARFIQQHVRGTNPGPPQTTTTEMWYDALGRRVLMRFRTDSTSCYNPPVDSTLVACQQAITRFSWDGDQLLRESRVQGGWQVSPAALDGTPASGTWYGTRRYTQTGSIDTPLLLWLNDGAPRAIVRNWRGSAAGGLLVSNGLSDGLAYPAARVSVQYESDSRMSAPPPDAWLGSLIDEQRDPTGLLYRRNRYYDPATGQFTQEDPIGLAGGMNLYGYANGDPVNYSDPFGLYRLDGVAAQLFILALQQKERAQAQEEAARQRAESDERTTMQVVGDFAAGFGDFITLGGTKLIRESIGCSDCVDYESGQYAAGQVAGGAAGTALGGLTAARAAGVTSRVAIHGAHHVFPLVGRAAHVQVNVWRIGVKGSGVAFRIPLPW